MENRNYFSLHCVQMETQLIHANLEAMYWAFHHLVNEEARGHAEVSGLGEMSRGPVGYGGPVYSVYRGKWVRERFWATSCDWLLLGWFRNCLEKSR